MLKRELLTVIEASDANEACAVAATMRDQLIQIGVDAGNPMKPIWRNKLT